VSRPEIFPESLEAKDEIVNKDHQRPEKKDDDIELLAREVSGTVSSRDTSSDPADIAGVADLDRGMRRARRK
jgi:hypothetical protein